MITSHRTLKHQNHVLFFRFVAPLFFSVLFLTEWGSRLVLAQDNGEISVCVSSLNGSKSEPQTDSDVQLNETDPTCEWQKQNRNWCLCPQAQSNMFMSVVFGLAIVGAIGFSITWTIMAPCLFRNFDWCPQWGLHKTG